MQKQIAEHQLKKTAQKRTKRQKFRRGSKEALLSCAGMWAGDRKELEQLEALVMQIREQNSQLPPYE